MRRPLRLAFGAREGGGAIEGDETSLRLAFLVREGDRGARGDEMAPPSRVWGEGADIEGAGVGVVRWPIIKKHKMQNVRT